MAKKEVVRVAKLQFNAGLAKPGPELAGLGIVMPEFTKQFNDATKDRSGEPVPVKITVYRDKSFDFKLFTAPASFKLKQVANIKKGSSNSKTTIVATIQKKQLEEIAKYKLVDLNTTNLNAAMATIAGTAKNMGILVEEYDDIKGALAEVEDAKKAHAAAQRADEIEQKLQEENKKAREVEVLNEKATSDKEGK